MSNDHEQPTPQPDLPQAEAPQPPHDAPQPRYEQPPQAQPLQATPMQAPQQTAPAQDPQWIPVPPPNPYATSTAQPATGKGLAITAMALGLLALFSSIVAGLYFSVFVVLAAFVALVAVIMGIVALVKRSNPKGAAITGLISGALAIVVSLVIGIVSVASVTSELITGATPGLGQDSNEGETSEDWSPDAPKEALIEWPANMASGGIVFTSHSGDPLPDQSSPLEPGTVPAPSAVDRATSNDLLIYVDYRCPHCLSFEEANSALLEQALADGASIEIVPLSFLDRASEGAYYSSRAAGAIACLADSQPEAAWAGHSALLSPQVQPAAGPGLSNDELVSVLESASGGLNSVAADCITSERFVGFAQALNSWVFANPVPNALDSSLSVQGTPLVLVNGEPYRGEPSDARAFASFYEEHTN